MAILILCLLPIPRQTPAAVPRIVCAAQRAKISANDFNRVALFGRMHDCIIIRKKRNLRNEIRLFCIGTVPRRTMEGMQKDFPRQTKSVLCIGKLPRRTIEDMQKDFPHQTKSVLCIGTVLRRTMEGMQKDFPRQTKSVLCIGKLPRRTIEDMQKDFPRQ